MALLLAVPALAGCVDAGLVSGGSSAEGCDLVPGEAEWPEFPIVPLNGLSAQATIKRDAYGVPHIYADDLYTLMYANGYAQAQDRLFLMDALRLVGYGESARWLGPGQLSSDIQVHRDLYTREELQAQLAAAPEDLQQILLHFSAGVNRYIIEAMASGDLPAEFAAIGRVPPLWQPLDSVAVIAYLIGYFGVDGGAELANARLLADLRENLPAEAAWDAFGDVNWLRIDDHYTTMAPEEAVLDGCEDTASLDVALPQLAYLESADVPALGEAVPTAAASIAPGQGIFEGFHWGSNALLVDASLSATGQPIMWGAPQMGYYKPPVPYQLGLHGAGFDAAGIGVTGAPAIVIGRNADIAWSATSGFEDIQDIVALPLAGPRSYTWDGETRTMDCWTVVHDLTPTPLGLSEGPVIPSQHTQEVCRADGWPVVAIDEDAGYAYMRKTTTRHEELQGAAIWLGAALTDSVESFQEHMRDFPFTFNFHVADHEQVLYLHTGKIPIRASGYDPRLPTPAGSAYEWRGVAYTGELPTWSTEPARGYFANWNNGPAQGWRSGDGIQQWGPVHRVQQIEHWMQERLDETGGKLTWDDVADVNWLTATHDSLALPVLPHLIDGAARAGLRDVEDALRHWYMRGAPWADDDGDGTYDDPAHAVWDFVYEDLLRRVQADEMGASMPTVHLEPGRGGSGQTGDHITANNILPTLLKALSGTTEHDWCDDATTTGRESCDALVEASLVAAHEHLVSTYGPEPMSWQAPVHLTGFQAIGAAVADERPMVNKGSWVQIVSMAESGRSASIMPPANSGAVNAQDLLMLQAGSEPVHLHGELDLYWSGAFKPFPLTPAEVDAVAASTQTLDWTPPFLTGCTVDC